MPTWKHAMTDNDIVGADRLNWLLAGGARTGPSRRVAAAAAAIFDGLGHVHGMTRTWRPVLGVAVAIGGTPAVLSAAPRDKMNDKPAEVP